MLILERDRRRQWYSQERMCVNMAGVNKFDDKYQVGLGQSGLETPGSCVVFQ